MASRAHGAILKSLVPPSAGYSVTRWAVPLSWSKVVFSFTFLPPWLMSRLSSVEQSPAVADDLNLSLMANPGTAASKPISKSQPFAVWCAESVASPRLRPLGQLRSEEHTSELQSLRHLVCRL